jgi:hypothetical protein
MFNISKKEHKKVSKTISSKWIFWINGSEHFESTMIWDK